MECGLTFEKLNKLCGGALVAAYLWGQLLNHPSYSDATAVQATQKVLSVSLRVSPMLFLDGWRLPRMIPARLRKAEGFGRYRLVGEPEQTRGVFQDSPLDECVHQPASIISALMWLASLLLA
jgi:hypothetical protein